MIKAKKSESAGLQIVECVPKPITPGTKSRGRMLRGAEWAIPGILAEILATGLQRIQTYARQRNPERCEIEAEHIRSLPMLLAEFKPELLDRYWNVERLAFIQQSSTDVADFEPYWRALDDVFRTRQEEIRAEVG